MSRAPAMQLDRCPHRGWRRQQLSVQVAPSHPSPHTAGSMPSSTSATILGVGAILLWSSLASLTVLKGSVPPFETTAIAFAIGGVVLVAAALLRRRARQLLPTPASLALGIYGLFCYHALYFAALRLAASPAAALSASPSGLLTAPVSGRLPTPPPKPQHPACAPPRLWSAHTSA